MTDGVVDREIHDVAVDRVVEPIAADPVGGFDEPGHCGCRHRRLERWELLPLQLGGQVHVMLAPLHLVAVGVRTLAHQQLSHERRQGVAEPALLGAQRCGELEPKHAQSLRTVNYRHPTMRNRVIGLDRLAAGKGAPGGSTGHGDGAIGISAVTAVVL